MKSLLRRMLGFAAIAAFMFAQAVFAAQPGDGMPSCHGAGDDAAACASHCAQPVPTVGSDAVAVSFVPGLVTRFPSREPHARQAAIRDPSLLHATSPPLAIRNCCFRI
jgi:hypothetical protein